VQDQLDFNELSDKSHMSPPDPKKVKVDDRYGEVNYYQRSAWFTVLDDGGIALGDGYGSRIVMSGGNIYLDCPGDVRMAPGRSLVGLGGDDIVLRAHNSFDATASNKDLRLKAEQNLQALAGNSGRGGMLLESKGSGTRDFDNKVGEEVGDSGVTVKAAQGDLSLWGQSIYGRTGGESLGSGDIVLDAGKGNRNVIVKGQNQLNYVSSTMTTYVGPDAQNSNVQAVHQFTGDGANLDQSLRVGGPMVTTGVGVIGGGLSVDGFIGTTRDAQNLSRIEGNALAQLRDTIQSTQSILSASRSAGRRSHNSTFNQSLYSSGRPGNEQLIQQAAFSYRDDQGGTQYNTRQFSWLESRWQQMIREEAGSGGTGWNEPTVEYQDREQMPWPGKTKWQDEKTLLQTQSPNLYDPESGHARNRGEQYENAQLAELSQATPDQAFKVIAGQN
jgi:hypothetical protein